MLAINTTFRIHVAWRDGRVLTAIIISRRRDADCPRSRSAQLFAKQLSRTARTTAAVLVRYSKPLVVRVHTHNCCPPHCHNTKKRLHKLTGYDLVGGRCALARHLRDLRGNGFPSHAAERWKYVRRFLRICVKTDLIGNVLSFALPDAVFRGGFTIRIHAPARRRRRRR